MNGGMTVGQQQWKAESYDTFMRFVSKGGEDLIDLLNVKPGERIIDWGCGTGDLAAALAAKGAVVRGIDFSREMIDRAKEKYPDLSFEAADGQSYVSPVPADAVFSNAALHWMTEAEGAAASIAASLKPGGRFVAEFGGDGNVSAICKAIQAGFKQRGIEDKLRFPWYFPSIGEYALVLERAGLRVDYAVCYDRPTPLEGGEQGLQIWLDQFARGIFDVLSSEEEHDIREAVESALAPRLFREGRWTADYRRIRVAAVKR